MIFERRLVCSRLRPSRHRWLAARYNQAPGPGSGSRLGSAARRWDREGRKRVGQPRSWPSGVLPARFWEACCRHEEKERGKAGCVAAGPWKLRGAGPRRQRRGGCCDVWRADRGRLMAESNTWWSKRRTNGAFTWEIGSSAGLFWEEEDKSLTI